MKKSIHPPPPSHLGSVWAADPTGRLLRGRSPVFFFWGGEGRWLVGGWTNTIEKYQSKWESSPGRGENYLKPPPSWWIPLKQSDPVDFWSFIMGKETIKHWFPFSKALIGALFLGGGGVAGVPLASHDHFHQFLWDGKTASSQRCGFVVDTAFWYSQIVRWDG